MSGTNFSNRIADELKISRVQVETVIGLLAEGATIPFIARYRKEATGELDEVAVMNIRDRLEELNKFDTRMKAILKSLKEQDKLTPDLEKKIIKTETLAVLEDLYLPYKPKKRTRAMAAREKGLEPLAKFILHNQQSYVEGICEAYISDEKGVLSVSDAIAGARDIIAEWISEDSNLRSEIRNIFNRKALLHSKLIKGKEQEGAKFRDYFDWSEPAVKSPSHRILAIYRGVSEGILRIHILPDEEIVLSHIKNRYLLNYQDNKVSVTNIQKYCAGSVLLALEDSYKRLLAPSMETELKSTLKKKADSEAIRVFGSNLAELLLDAPLGQKRVLAVDPGLRTGCKIVCLDSSGKLLKNDTIFLIPPEKRIIEAGLKMEALIREYKIEAIAVGNGTGGREALSFFRKLKIDKNIIISSVNENGASVYSASEAGREEFPDYDLTVRGAVSIGRRLMDPLSELIKIEPKSIGVGQYQHDVDQKKLKDSLDDVVISCVNKVGVEVNTSSSRLLKYVSGLSPKLASSIVSFRESNGPYKSRNSLMKVSGMGNKSFQQSAGFLRIRNAENPLDNSAVHPESYSLVEKMALNAGIAVEDMVGNNSIIDLIVPEDYIDDKTGLPTIIDILSELKKPGRDPRESFTQFSFSEGVSSMDDLAEGMVLPGIISNVTAFGAFADIGVHQDGLIHISQLSDSFVRDPMKIVKVNQKIKVRVLAIDLERKRISLSMKGL